MTKYGLMKNEWFSTNFDMRHSWIPAYLMDVPLAGILRTTSRSESANSFFNRFIHRKLTFVEFWLRFDIALECQREEELKPIMQVCTVILNCSHHGPWRSNAVPYLHMKFSKSFRNNS
jgi:hypothetical protein